MNEASSTDWTPVIVAAIVAGTSLLSVLVGALLTRFRNRQDRESQWRQHAIDLAKLDLQRRMARHNPERDEPLRPSVLDFLANYRDLQELDTSTPAELYRRIEEKRIAEPPSERHTVTSDDSSPNELT